MIQVSNFHENCIHVDRTRNFTQIGQEKWKIRVKINLRL
jgi:hypothetical protein